MDFNGNGDILTCKKHFLSPDLPLLETPQLPPIMAPSPKQPPNSDFQGGSAPLAGEAALTSWSLEPKHHPPLPSYATGINIQLALQFTDSTP